MPRPASLLVCCSVVVAVLNGRATAGEPPRLEFTRLVAHWAEYADPGYLSFLEDARPEIAQVGFYGGHFWSLAHTPHGGGYPAHFPVQGLGECGDWLANLNREVHRRGIKVVGHFNVKFLVGDPESPDGPRGFFKFYRDLWNEDELGAKPVADPMELLEKNADGTPLSNRSYSIGGMAEYWGCLNNPHWRAVLKAWVRKGIQREVDGFIVNYFYRHNCLCRYCQAAFRDHLTQRFSRDELERRFGIANLERHRFTEIVGWHNPAESTPLRREMLRFSQTANKQAFDEVFLDYGRSIKPDLIAAQWNHLGDFHQISGDERCLLPADRWGKGEDYLWYSSGGAAVYTDLAEGFLGELTLQCRYIRGAFDDKPFTMGKYESTRIRAAIAELAANGGAPMGFYTRFTDPAARKVIVRYYRFLGQYDELYRGNRPYAEAVLLYPRSRVHNGDVASVERFKKLGRKLLDAHVLFDVLPDDLATHEKLSAYDRVFSCEASPAEVQEELKVKGSASRLSRFDAPATVRVSASRPAGGDDLVVHFVNYNRQEPEEKRSPGTGIADEKPIPVRNVKADVALPRGFRVRGVEVMSPKAPEPTRLEFDLKDGRLRFTAGRFLVYAVARIRLEEE